MSQQLPPADRLLQLFSEGIPEIDYSGTEGRQPSYRGLIENQLGTITLPVGLAGPLRLTHGSQDTKQYFIPIASTEGTLIPSIQRGLKVIREGSEHGAHARVYRVGVPRSPVLRFQQNPFPQLQMEQWAEDHFPQMQQSAASTSEHLSLSRCAVRVEGSYLFFLFHFDTAEAMGMNMVSIGTEKIVEEVILPHLPVEMVSLSSNWCSDKKPGQMHTQFGRGRRVVAEVTLSEEVITQHLHTTLEQLNLVAQTKLVLGSSLAGSPASNAHHANVVSGFFLATGQDAGHVVEGAAGSTIVTLQDGALRMRVDMPSVMLGSVGGGTELPLPQQYRSLIGLESSVGLGEQTDEMAAVLGGAVLAGEISLLGALAAQELTEAHMRFRRVAG